MRPRYAGISAQVPPEYAPTSFRNPCPSPTGFSAQVRPEYAMISTLTLLRTLFYGRSAHTALLGPLPLLWYLQVLQRALNHIGTEAPQEEPQIIVQPGRAKSTSRIDV